MRRIINPTVVLDRQSFFKGTLKFDRSVRIDGRFEGTIETTGSLYINEGADIKADIKADTIVIAGNVVGDIEVLSRMELLNTGKLQGNTKVPRDLILEDGATFEGRVDMVNVPGTIDIFSTSLPQLKKSLSGNSEIL